jgi:hypothetical protein
MMWSKFYSVLLTAALWGARTGPQDRFRGHCRSRGEETVAWTWVLVMEVVCVVLRGGMLKVELSRYSQVEFEKQRQPVTHQGLRGTGQRGTRPTFGRQSNFKAPIAHGRECRKPPNF